MKEKRGRRFSRLALIGSIRIRSFGSRKMNSKAEISGASRDCLVKKVDTFILERERFFLNRIKLSFCFLFLFVFLFAIINTKWPQWHSGKAKDHRFKFVMSALQYLGNLAYLIYPMLFNGKTNIFTLQI